MSLLEDRALFPSWLICALEGYDLSDWEPSDAVLVREMTAGLAGDST
jgi:hypothetical protein